VTGGGVLFSKRIMLPKKVPIGAWKASRVDRTLNVRLAPPLAGAAEEPVSRVGNAIWCLLQLNQVRSRDLVPHGTEHSGARWCLKFGHFSIHSSLKGTLWKSFLSFELSGFFSLQSKKPPLNSSSQIRGLFGTLGPGDKRIYGWSMSGFYQGKKGHEVFGVLVECAR